MAKIEVTGWVSDWKYQTNEENPEWGMKLNEAHWKKNAADQFEVAGNTNFTVKAAYGVTIDFRNYKAGDKVLVKGTQVTETRGEYKNLVIKAESIEVLPSKPSARVSAMIAETLPAPVIEDAPF
jgi:hypothetical protein